MRERGVHRHWQGVALPDPRRDRLVGDFRSSPFTQSRLSFVNSSTLTGKPLVATNLIQKHHPFGSTSSTFSGNLET